MTSKWLNPGPRIPNAALRLFCFHYAGGSAAMFAPWRTLLPGFVEVQAVQLPGRGIRIKEEPVRDVHSVVESIVDALNPVFREKPFALFGHSMGALIAFETARRLSDQRIAHPLSLLVSGKRAPQVPRREPPSYHLPDEQFMAKLRELNGTPAEVLQCEELMRVLLPIVRADFELTEKYEYSPSAPLRCPIIAFGGSEDREVTRNDLEPWSSHTSAGFSLRMLPGDHFFIHSHQPLLLQLLTREMHCCRQQLSGAPAAASFFGDAGSARETSGA